MFAYRKISMYVDSRQKFIGHRGMFNHWWKKYRAYRNVTALNGLGRSEKMIENDIKTFSQMVVCRSKTNQENAISLFLFSSHFVCVVYPLFPLWIHVIYISVLGSYFSTIFANPKWFPWKNPFIYEKIQSIHADININNVFVSVRQVFRFFFHICISHFANSKNFIPSVRYTFQFHDIQCPKQIRKVSNYFKNVTIEMQSCPFCEIFLKKKTSTIYDALFCDFV